MQLQQAGGVAGTVHLTETGQHFAHRLQVVAHGKVAVAAQVLNVVENILGIIKAFNNEGVGAGQLLLVGEEAAIDLQYARSQRREGFLPAVFLFGVGEQ